MSDASRRLFLKAAASGLAGAWLGLALEPARAAGGRRKFTMDLRCGSIGVKANLPAAIDYAHRYGFESVEPSAAYLARLSEAERSELVDRLKEKNLVWGAAGLPVNFRGDDGSFRAGMEKLPELARALQAAGVRRVGTWISPTHTSLTYLANFHRHVRRLGQVAEVLGDSGLRFGLEYVGPKTSWTAARYPFIHTMAETKELIAEIGRDNVGFVLDSWHWYTAGETVEDVLSLGADDVVACDLNDAPAGIPVDQQRDGSRELPAATGVIDLAGFLGALIRIGYDGPVRAEPFNRRLNAMDNDQALAATAAALRKAFALADG